MVRTKADRVPTKAVGSKAPHKAVKNASVRSTPVKKATGSGKGKSYSGGNPYHPRETPDWQKPITCFLNQNASNETTSSSEVQENEDHNTNEEAGSESE